MQPIFASLRAALRGPQPLLGVHALRGILATTFLLIFASSLAADEASDAEEAYKSGHFEAAIAQFTPLAEAGSVEAQNRLAHIYRNGDGVPVDDEMALHWTRLAAKQNSARAQFFMHVHYLNGRGVQRDAEAAKRWLLRSAAQGDPVANYNLYAEAARNGGEKAEAAALTYLQRAVDLDGADGQFALGQAYLFGLFGLRQDTVQALKLFRLAADKQHMEALVVAGGMLGHTDLSDVDYPQSAIYLRAATRDGCWAVGEQLLLVLSAMPFEDLMRADQQFAEWMESHPPPEPHRHRALPEVCVTTSSGNENR